MSETKRRDAVLTREVARSVDAPANLVPAFGELFKGMPNLGSQPGRLLAMLRRAGVGRESRVIDLACGKGTTAITLARRLGCRVVAVDACGAFVDEARQAAARVRVADRVEFIQTDLRRAAARERRRRTKHDAALMMGLFGLAEARKVLRPLVTPGGLYVIDDVVRDPRLTDTDEAFHEIPTRDESRAMLERDGDRVVEVDVPTPAQVRALNRSLYTPLAANARRLAKTQPRLRPALATFLDNQRHANRLLGRELRPAVWVVRRGR